MIQAKHQLMHLAQAYFHQDFDLEAPTPLDIVDLFVAGEPQAAVDELVSDLRSLMDSAMTNADMRGLWINDYGASYDPMAEGIEYRRWFTDILERLPQG
jgi:hypothetical protein